MDDPDFHPTRDLNQSTHFPNESGIELFDESGIEQVERNEQRLEGLNSDLGEDLSKYLRRDVGKNFGKDSDPKLERHTSTNTGTKLGSDLEGDLERDIGTEMFSIVDPEIEANVESSMNPKTKAKKNSLWSPFIKEYILPKKFDENDFLQMGPLEKFIKYKRIPLKLIIDTLLCTLLLVFVFLNARSSKKFVLSNTRGFIHHFLPSDNILTISESNQGFYSSTFTTISDILNHFNYVVERAYAYNTSSVDSYYMEEPPRLISNFWNFDIRSALVTDYIPGSDPIPTISPISLFDGFHFFLTTKEINEYLTLSNPYGVFGGNSNHTRVLFDKWKDSVITLKFKNLDPNRGESSRLECYLWTIRIHYDFNVRTSKVYTKFKSENSGCVTEKYSLFDIMVASPHYYISMAVIVLSTISFILNVKAAISRVFTHIKLRKKDPSAKISWIQFYWKYFGFWYPLGFLKDIFNIIGAIFHLSHVFSPESIPSIFFISMGCLFTFIASMRYFQYIPALYTLIMTFRLALPQSFRYIIGVMPLFLGCTFASTVWFGHYVTYFENLSNSAVSNFSCLFGDVLRDTFDMLYGWSALYRIWGRLYLYSFVILFITVIITMFLLIIQDAYFSIFGNYQHKAPQEEVHEQVKHESFSVNNELKEVFLSPHFQDQETDTTTTSPPSGLKRKLSQYELQLEGDDDILNEMKDIMSFISNSSTDLNFNNKLIIRIFIEAIQKKIYKLCGKIEDEHRRLMGELLIIGTRIVSSTNV